MTLQYGILIWQESISIYSKFSHLALISLKYTHHQRLILCNEIALRYLLSNTTIPATSTFLLVGFLKLHFKCFLLIWQILIPLDSKLNNWHVLVCFINPDSQYPPFVFSAYFVRIVSPLTHLLYIMSKLSLWFFLILSSLEVISSL